MNWTIYCGSIIIALWGIAHLVPTKAILNSYGAIPREQKLIAAMGWITEGFFLVFIGKLVFIVNCFGDPDSYTAILVFRYSGVMLLALAILSFFTGFRTKIIPMKICPFVKILCAVLITVGSL